MLGSNTLISSFMEQRTLHSLISNEAEDTSGRTAAEIERVIYARVSNFDFLERAAGAERQEQWSVKIPKTAENAGSGSIRVRKVTNLREPGAAVQYILTSKLDIGQKGSAAETSEQSSVDQFNVFKYFANKGMLKDRYVFDIEGSDRQWEVDCFQKPGALYSEWVKIDLEGWPSGEELPQLPFTAAETIDGDKTKQTAETQAKISRMYEDIFLLKNTNEPLGTPADQVQSEGSGQPGVAPDTGEQAIENKDGLNGGAPLDDDGEESQNSNVADAGGGANADANADGANADDKQKKEGDNANDDSNKAPGDGLGEVTKEAFSSLAQTLAQVVPVLGPLALLTKIHGSRSGTGGNKVFGVDIETKQHTTKGAFHFDASGRKTGTETKTGSYNLVDLSDAKDYISLITDAVHQLVSKKKNIERIDMTLWPQKDGRFNIFNIRTDRDGEVKVFSGNNPGKLKWFSMSLSGKRLIRLSGEMVEQFNFNGRTIRVPFDGRIVEFDVGQLRMLSYQTIPHEHAFDKVEYNFDN